MSRRGYIAPMHRLPIGAQCISAQQNVEVALHRQPADWIGSNHIDGDFVPEKSANIVYAVKNHSRPAATHMSYGRKGRRESERQPQGQSHLSRESPQAIARTSGGSGYGSIISGRNIPELPTSTHFLRSGWYEKISMDGSVYGLYAGLNRQPVSPAIGSRSRIIAL
jgi:hypothetical protein